MATGIHTIIKDLVWKTMNMQLLVVKISDRIKAVLPTTHKKTGPQIRCGEQGKPRKVAT